MHRFLIFAFVMTIAFISVASAEQIAPVGMNNKSIGGADLNQYTLGVYNGVGTHNIGLLIKTWGKVTKLDSDNKFFYINDGSNRLDGSGFTGVKVYYGELAEGVVITNPPAEGSYVAVTAIVSTTIIRVNEEDRIQPMLRIRRQPDIQLLKSP